MKILRKYFSVWLVFGLGFTVSILAFSQLHSVETRRSQLEFRSAVSERVGVLRNELNLYFSLLESVAAFFYASDQVSEYEFSTFSAPLLTQRDSLQFLEWVPYVRHFQRADYEYKARVNQPNFQFTEYETEQHLVTAGKRDSYFPVYYLHSRDEIINTQGVSGFDLGSEGQRLASLQAARDTGQIIITPWLPLLQLQSSYTVLPYGFLMIKPLYYRQHEKLPTTETERREQLRGFIVGGFVLEDLIKNAFHYLDQESFRFQISEIMLDGQLPVFVYHHRNEYTLEEQDLPLLRGEQILSFGGRQWRLVAFAPMTDLLWVWLVLFGGVAFTLLACLHLLMLINRNSKIQQEMQHRQQIAAALEKQEAEFRQFVNHAPVMLWMTNAQGACLLLNDTLREFVGNIAPADFMPHWQARIHPEDIEAYHAIAQQAAKTNHQSFHRVYRVQRQDACYRWIAETSIVRPAEENLGSGFIGACADITRRKEIEEALRTREAEFQTFLDHAPVMLWMSDNKGINAMFNETLRHFAGLRIKETDLGESWIALIHPQDVEFCRRAYRRAFTLSEDYHIQYRCLRADGFYRWIAETGAARFNAQNEFLGFTAACYDITKQKEAQQAMQESQRMLKTLMSNLPGIAYRCQNNEQWLMEFVSEGCQAVTGYAPDTFVQNEVLNFVDIIHPEDRAIKWQTVQQALADKQPYKLTYRIITQQQEERWVWEQGRGIFQYYTEGEQLEALEGFILDVTEQKRTEDALQQSRQIAEEASIAKSQFLANMSHELRTPLNAILGYTEILQEEAEDMELGDFIPDLQKILASGRHLLSLINDILDISKIEAGKMDVYIEKFSVSTVLEEVLTTIQPLVRQKHNELRLEMADNLGYMHSDLLKLRQSLLNLLSNSAKFTTNGVITLKIWRETVMDGSDWLLFEVHDTGIGMTQEQQSRLFQSFSQADTSTTRKYGGTGLGLAITYRFIEMMQGKITVFSEHDQGSTFCLYLPAVMSNDSTPLPVEKMHAHPLPVKNGVVLVIDDDEDARNLLSAYLTRVGYQVTTASDGASGLTLAKTLLPDAITLDIMMPDMDGWTVLTKLRSDAATAEIPIIVLSMVEDKNIGYSLGATDYLIKPVNRDQLVTLLRRYHVGDVDFNVLIVEDDHTVSDSIHHTLTAAGCVVAVAEHGKQALQQMTQQIPDLILLDLTMPEMDGFEFLHQMRQHDDWQQVPVVVLTSRHLSEQERTQLQGCVDSIFQKGAYQREALLTEVNRLLLDAVRQQHHQRALNLTTDSYEL